MGDREDSESEEVNHDASLPRTRAENTSPLINGRQEIDMAKSTEDAGVRFEALVKERDTLRVEVTQLRQSLEELQEKHQTSLDTVREELQETQTGKEHAEEQYQTLLGRVNTIKAQLGERLKADAVRRNLPPANMHKSEAIS